MLHSQYFECMVDHRTVAEHLRESQWSFDLVDVTSVASGPKLNRKSVAGCPKANRKDSELSCKTLNLNTAA